MNKIEAAGMRNATTRLSLKHFWKLGLLILVLVASGKSQVYNESKDFSYALKLYNEGFYDIAAQQFSAFINRYAESSRLPEAKLYLANSLFKQKDYENARVEYQSLAVTFPNDSRAPEAWQKVGDCYRLLGKLKEAAKSYETVKMLFPRSSLAPAAYLEAGNLYLQLGDDARAEKIVRDFLDRYLNSPQYPAGRLLYGKLLLRQRKLDRAAKELSNVLKLSDDPKIRADARLTLAAVYRKLGLSAKAEAEYTHILQNPDTPKRAFTALTQLATELLNVGKYDESVSVLGKYGSRLKGNSQTAINILKAKAEFLKKDYFSCQKILSSLLNTDVSDSLRFDAKFYLAVCRSRENKLTEALKLFRELTSSGFMEKADEMAPLLFKEAFQTALSAEQFNTAAAYLRQLKEKYPKFAGIEALEAKLLLATLAAGRQMPPESKIEAFIQSHPNSPDSPDILYAGGRVLFREGRFSRSRQYFQRILKEYPAYAKSDSARSYITFIQNFHQARQSTGIYELTQLMEKFLLNEDRMKLLNRLGLVYFHDLQNYEEAARVFAVVTQTATDSTTLGKAYFYLTRSLIRQAEKKSFVEGKPEAGLLSRIQTNLANGMKYIKYVPEPDRLTFDYLSWAADRQNTPPDKLLKFWKRFVALYDTSVLLPRALMHLADISLQKGDSTVAVSYLNQLIAISTDDYGRGNGYWRKIEIFRKQGRDDMMESALKDFLLQVPVHPRSPEAYARLADLAEKKGKYSIAAQFWEKLRSTFAYSRLSREAARRIPELYIRQNEIEKALQLIQNTLKQFAEYDDPVLRKIAGEAPPIYYFYEGKGYFVRNQWNPARKSLLSYLNRSSALKQRGEALYLLGTIAIKQNDPEGALLQFSLVPRDDQFYVPATASAAEILYRQRKFAAARQKYDTLIAATNDPDKLPFYSSQKIRCLINEKSFKLAEEQIRKFKTRYKQNPRLKNYLASFEFELGKVAFQNKNFLKAVKHMKLIARKYKQTDYLDDAEYYLGLSYAIQNQDKKAEKQFSDFLKKYPQSSILGDVYVSLGNLYFRQEKSDLAIQSFRQALAVSGSASTRQAAMTNLTRIYQNLGQWDAVLQVAREYVKQFPHASDIMDKNILIGICLTNLNRYNEAIDFLKKIRYIADSDEEPEIQFYIGQAYFNAGQYENAITEFVKIPLLSKRTKLQWEASALYYSGQAYEKLGRNSDAVRMYQEIINRPGILVELKREARKRIAQLAKNN